MIPARYYGYGEGYRPSLVAESAGDALSVLEPIAERLQERWKFRGDDAAEELFLECDGALAEIREYKESAKTMDTKACKDAIHRIADIRNRFVYKLDK